MANFRITDAAFTGFRVVRERPVAVLGWAALQFLMAAPSMLLLAAFAGPTMVQFRDHGLPDNADAIVAMGEQLVKVEPALVGLSLVIGAVLAAAMNRAVLRPEDSRFCYLRLGFDELRQLGLKLLLLALAMAAVTVVATLADLAAATPAVGALVLCMILAAALVGGVYVFLRLSLASAATFATGRIGLMGSWALTRGQAPSILKAYALALALCAVVLALGLQIVWSVMSLASGDLSGDGKGFVPDPSSLASVIKPLPIAYLALVSLVYGLMSPLLSGPLAYIYQWLTTYGARPAPGKGLIA